MLKSNFGMTSRELEGGRPSRRDFLAGVGVVMVGASALPAAAAAALLQAKPGAGGVSLFNGKDLSGFYTHLAGSGKNNDPKRVFRVTDGMLHITGEVNGGIISEQSYENYRLVAEYKWGETMWPPREKGAMDCGLLMHCGKEDAVAVGLWPQSIQCQIYQGAVGDLVLLPGKDILTGTVEGEERNGVFQYVPGVPAQERQAGGTKRFEIIQHIDKDPEWKNEKGFHSANDATHPHDQWNRVEVVADGDTLTATVNGKLVNKMTNLGVTSGGTKAPLARGGIGIQSESGEIFFRRLELLPLR